VKTSHTPTRPPPTVVSRVPSGLHAHDVTGPGRVSCRSSAQISSAAMIQGLTLVHFSAERDRFLWDRGCGWNLCWVCSGVV